MPTTGRISIIGSAASTLTAPTFNQHGTMFDIVAPSYEYSDGTLSGQCDLAWSDRLTLPAGNTGIIDLVPLTWDNGGGAVIQLEVFGTQPSFTEVVGIVISNRETAPGTRILHFGPSFGANPFLWLFAGAGDLAVLVPGGAYCMWSNEPQTTVGGTSDSLRFINTDGVNAVTFDILIVGRSV
jgi:hypothetical protein